MGHVGANRTKTICHTRTKIIWSFTRCLLKNETDLGPGRKKKKRYYIIITRARERMFVMIYIIPTRVHTYMYSVQVSEVYEM